MSVVETIYYRMLSGGEVQATAECLLDLVRDTKTLMPLEFKRSSHHPADGFYCCVQIVRMNTKPQYQRQGVMTKIIDTIFADHKTLWIQTSWDDSSESGRAFCLKNGFVQEGDLLIRRKPHASNF
jgi:tRNA(Met) C34 N-acetyltransferase TmcA